MSRSRARARARARERVPFLKMLLENGKRNLEIHNFLESEKLFMSGELYYTLHFGKELDNVLKIIKSNLILLKVTRYLKYSIKFSNPKTKMRKLSLLF